VKGGVEFVEVVLHCAHLGLILRVFIGPNHVMIYRKIIFLNSRHMQRLFHEAAGLAMRGLLSQAFQLLRTFLRRRMISVWVMGRGVPPPGAGAFIESPASRSLGSFMVRRPLGATLFWAVSGAGKTHALANVAARQRGDQHRFVHVDWRGFFGDNPLRTFYRTIGMDPEEDIGPLSAYIPNDRGIFTTIVFDHFDDAISTAAVSMVSALADDSIRCGFYNVLVMLNDASNARMLLSRGHHFPFLYTRLLGSAFCGRWCADDLVVDDTDRRAFVDQSGVMLFGDRCVSSSLLFQLRAAQSQRAWEEGEALLGCFREDVP